MVDTEDAAMRPYEVEILSAAKEEGEEFKSGEGGISVKGTTGTSLGVSSEGDENSKDLGTALTTKGFLLTPTESITAKS